MKEEQADINLKPELQDLFPPDTYYTYKTIGDRELKLHVFNPQNHQVGDRTPGAIFFFGGGWSGGHPRQFYPFSREMARKGMVAICAEYRTRNDGGVEPYECLKDAKAAVRWCRRNADKLGIDPDKFAAGGGSAGGHLAAACAIIEDFNHDDDDNSISCIPDALLLFNPVVDNSPDGYGYDRLKERYKEFSPLHNISAKTPVSLFFVGEFDTAIPPASAEKFKAEVEANGGECELHIYEGVEHGFFNYGRPGGYYEKTLQALLYFLKNHGYIR